MIRRVIVNAFLIIFSFVLQTSLFRVLSIAGCAPNLLLIVIVSWAVMRGDLAGMLTGFFGGLLCDSFSGGLIGVFALVYMMIGFSCGRFRKSFYPENMMQPLGIIAGSDFVFGLINYIIFFLFRAKYHFFFYLIHIIIPEVIYTVIMALLLYPLILRINTLIEDIESRSERKFV